MLAQLTNERLLKRTTSRCPVCREPVPAEVIHISTGSTGKDSKVYLQKTCPEHGLSAVCIASDARFYWLAQGDPANACCGGTACCASDDGREGTLGRNAGGGSFETLATCLALIEIVNSCNLACPTCFADSPVGATGTKLDAIPIADLQRRIDGVIARKGPIEILQLSGGEPTLHPDFFELLAWTQSHKDIGYVLLNTNGVRIATDAAFAQRLQETFAERRLQLYLQFDGAQEAGQRDLRGADLRATREKAILRCEAMGLPVTLAMTVTPQNLPNIWDAIEYGLRFTNVRGVAFQPMFLSGRSHAASASGEPAVPGKILRAPAHRLNTADIILAAVEQAGGKLRFEDFTPLPCGDPNCATIGYLLKTPAGIRSISDFIDFTSMHGFLRDKMNFSLEDLSRCGCENQPLADLLHKFEMKESDTFRLLIKPFMDAWTWDQDRIDRCCTHVIRPDGQLDSFCRYYSGFAN